MAERLRTKHRRTSQTALMITKNYEKNQAFFFSFKVREFAFERKKIMKELN
jgi:hypothetical protein